MIKALGYTQAEVLALVLADASKRTEIPVAELKTEVNANGYVTVSRKDRRDIPPGEPQNSFRIIRAGNGFNPVIIITPASADHSSEGARYFELSRLKDCNRIEDWKPGEFNEIDRGEAMLAFCGMADGWGYEVIPDRTFSSIQEVMVYILTARVSSST